MRATHSNPRHQPQVPGESRRAAIIGARLATHLLRTARAPTVVQLVERAAVRAWWARHGT